MASQYDLPYTGPQVETLLAKISELESEMPSKTSDLTNDSGFITSENVPTKTSDLNNDSGFITNAPVAAEAARAQAAEALLATISSLQAEISRATGVEGTLQDLIDGIAAKIPSAATDQNQLADKAFVNSSIATATATFRGTYDSLAELQAVSADENDYGYVRTTDAAGNTVFKRYKYASGSWVFEYDLNNSSFTASQWAAINSAITAELVEKLRALPTATALAASLAEKYVKPSSGIPESDIADGVIPDISGKVNTSDIADNLTTNDATKVLSAKQGKVLNDNLTQFGQTVSDLEDFTAEISVEGPNYIDGKGINYTGLFDAPGGVTTHYVPVTPGVAVTITYGGSNVTNGAIVKYGADKSYVDWSSQAITTKTTPIPSNVYYIRACFVKANLENCSIKQNDVDIWSPVTLVPATMVRTIEQTLTDAEKEQARTNIGAASNEDIQAIESELDGIDSTISSTDYNISANSNISQFVTIPKDGCKMRILVDSSVWPSVEIHKVSADHQTIETSYENIVPGVWYPMEKTAERPDILIYKATSTSTQKTMTVDFGDPYTIEGKLDAIAGTDPLRVVVFGDSLTEFGGTKKKSIAQWLEDKMCCDSVSLGVGGTRISQRGTPTATPENLNEAYAVFDLPNWVKTWVDDDFTTADACNTYLAGQGDDNTKILARAKNCRPTDFDVAVIFMGTNDFTAEANMGTASSADDGTANNTLSGALKYAIKTLLTANPTLKIYVFTPIVRYLSSPWADSEFSDNKVINGIHLYDVEDAIAVAAKPFHIPVCKWYWTLGWNQTNFDQYFNAPDGTHPDDGYEYLAEKMAHFIMSH